MTNSPPPQPPAPLNERIADWLLKAIMAGGVAGGGIGAFWALFKDENILKAVLSAGIGLGISYGAKLLQPIHKGNEERLTKAGEAINRGIDQRLDQLSAAAISRITAVEDRYRACQAADCETYRTEGVGKSSGIFTPLLDQVFVPLELDRSALAPGFCPDPQALTPQSRELWESPTVDIWQLLARTQRDPIYSKIAILAWGGYGKTTLLRHVAYTLGKNRQPSDVPPYIPVLLLLRKYRDLLSQDDPPNLPRLIVEHHVPSLPVSEGLQITVDWVREKLRQGKLLIMLDGFDEVPKDQRPGVARWLNAQLLAYRQSVFMLTTRPKAYTEQTGADRLDFNTLLWVRNFNAQQRRDFVERWYWCQEYYHHGKADIPAVRQAAQAAAEDLLHQIEQRAELADLTQNPLLLNMTALFHRRYPGAKLPRRRVELYQELCLLQLRDRPDARQIDTCLGDCDAQTILQLLALEMMQQKAERIDQAPLLEHLSDYLKAQDEPVPAREFLEQVEQVSELLVQREPEEYEFAHLSFQEFLAAKEIARQQREALLYEHLTEDWWKQVILLYVAQVKPSRFIRKALALGATDLAYECWQETRKRIDDDLRQDLEELHRLRETATVVETSRYAQLEAYLKAQQWREADRETYRLMITAVGKTEGQWFTSQELETFPCEDLKAIDGLWVKYSQGKFGFSVQKQIWQECGSPKGTGKEWDHFCVKVGWQDTGTRYLDYRELKANLKFSPTGEFPCRFMFPEFPDFGGVEHACVFLGDVSVLFSRTETCKL